jgi:hypothetical protein
MTLWLNRLTVRRLQTMADAGLITYRELQPWAESLLLSMEKPPNWLCNVAIQTYGPDVLKSLGEYIWSEPFESAERADVDDEYLGSLYLRFERNELSWATFLDSAGKYADRADGTWVCEEFFQMLNELEDADFAVAVARKQQVSVETKLKAAVERIRPLYEELRVGRRRGQ